MIDRMPMVPTATSTAESTIEAMRLNRKKNQYSLRRARPEKTAYFFSACRYQFMEPPVVGSCYGNLMLRCDATPSPHRSQGGFRVVGAARPSSWARRA